MGRPRSSISTAQCRIPVRSKYSCCASSKLLRPRNQGLTLRLNSGPKTAKLRRYVQRCCLPRLTWRPCHSGDVSAPRRPGVGERRFAAASDGAEERAPTPTARRQGHTELENGHAPTVSYGESSRTAASRWTAPSIRVARGSLSQLGRSRYSAGRREVRPQHLPSRADHALKHGLEGGPGPRVQSRTNNDDGQHDFVVCSRSALGTVTNTNSKLLIYGLFQEGRVLAQDGVSARSARALRAGSMNDS